MSKPTYEQLQKQNETQAELITSKNLKISRLKRERCWLRSELERERGRAPTQEEIAYAVFGVQS